MLDESTFHQNYLMHPRQFVTIIMEQFAEIKNHSNKEKIQSLGLHSFMLPPFLFDYLHLRTN